MPGVRIFLTVGLHRLSGRGLFIMPMTTSGLRPVMLTPAAIQPLACTPCGPKTGFGNRYFGQAAKSGCKSSSGSGWKRALTAKLLMTLCRTAPILISDSVFAQPGGAAEPRFHRAANAVLCIQWRDPHQCRQTNYLQSLWPKSFLCRVRLPVHKRHELAVGLYEPVSAAAFRKPF